MRTTSRRVFGLSLLAYCASFLFFAIYSIVTFEPKQVLASLLWTWVWENSLVLFVQTLVPVQCSALLLAYSLARPRRIRRPGSPPFEPFYRLVDSALVTLLVLTLIFTAMDEGVLPLAQRARQSLIDRTALAQSYYASYQGAVRDNEPAAGERFLKLYLEVNPGDSYAASQYAELRLNNLRKNLPPQASAADLSARDRRRVENESTQSLIALARQYLAAEDYASAQYYASLALQLSPGSATASRILAESAADLSRATPSAAERERQAYFALKSRGRTELEQGNPIPAYYLFQSLSKEHPNDPDVKTYLARATEQLAQFAFFREEIDNVAVYPGNRDVLFVEQREAGARDFVYLKKLIVTSDGTYVEGIDVIQLSAAGTVNYQLAAPYGKMIGTSLSMYCIGSADAVSYLPRIVAGSYPESHRFQIPISASIGILQQLGGRGVDIAQAALPRLLELARSAPALGFQAAPIQVEIFRRVMVPFSFLILSVFSIGVGWSLRVRQKRRFSLAYLFVPFFPFVLDRLYGLYLFSGKVLFGFLLTLTTFSTTLIVLAALQLVLLVLSLVYLAGQSVEE